VVFANEVSNAPCMSSDMAIQVAVI